MNWDIGMAIRAKSPNQEVVFLITVACVLHAPMLTWKRQKKSEELTHITTQASILHSRKEMCRFSAPMMQASAIPRSTLPLFLNRTRICGVDAKKCF